MFVCTLTASSFFVLLNNKVAQSSTVAISADPSAIELYGLTAKQHETHRQGNDLFCYTRQITSLIAERGYNLKGIVVL